jgi:hypothetical protein
LEIENALVSSITKVANVDSTYIKKQWRAILSIDNDQIRNTKIDEMKSSFEDVVNKDYIKQLENAKDLISLEDVYNKYKNFID